MLHSFMSNHSRSRISRIAQVTNCRVIFLEGGFQSNLFYFHPLLLNHDESWRHQVNINLTRRKLSKGADQPTRWVKCWRSARLVKRYGFSRIDSSNISPIIQELVELIRRAVDDSGDVGETQEKFDPWSGRESKKKQRCFHPNTFFLHVDEDE